MKLIIFVTLCQCLINLSFAGDGYCYTKWMNGRWVSVGDCDNPSAEDVLKKLRENVAKKEEIKTWYRASNGLYYKLFNDPVTYATAKSNCQNRGGDLASVGIRNPTVFNGEILPMIKSVEVDTWIGLDDIQQEGAFVWADGVTLSDQDSFWSTDQPDDHKNQEDCVHLSHLKKWKFNDNHCSTSNRYICEIKLN
ncbi:lectin-like [Styela clava]